jgi:hypothetical protein
LSVNTARSACSSWKTAAKVLSAGTASPKPAPRKPVATSSTAYATVWSLVSDRLKTSRIIATRLPARPARRRRFAPKRVARFAPRSEAMIAKTTCGKNIHPYCVLVSPYVEGSRNTLLAAGNVTSATPWTSPAA